MNLITACERLDKYTAEYKYIRIFIVYVWIHSYNFLFHKGTQRQTLFYFYAADLDFDLKPNEFSCKGAFPKIQTVIHASGNDVCLYWISDCLVMTSAADMMEVLPSLKY